MAQKPSTRVLLLVEDNPGDADLVHEMLETAGGEHFQILHATRLTDAIDRIKDNEIDVILLDLRLPDGVGVDTVRRVKSASRSIPIVVLTGMADEELALSCIDAGAQDYICKSEIRPVTLRRSIGYAITRLREAQVRELQETLEHYRNLSSASAETTVTAALAGTGSLKERYRQQFLQLVTQYRALIMDYLNYLTVNEDKPLPTMEHLVTLLGDLAAGPRDLLDLHVEALNLSVQSSNGQRNHALTVDGRLLALEMMGLLVDYYRVGTRRRIS